MTLTPLESSALASFRRGDFPPQPTGDERSDWIQVGLAIALNAARLLRGSGPSVDVAEVDLKSDGSPVTDLDRRVEEMVRTALADFHPTRHGARSDDGASDLYRIRIDVQRQHRGRATMARDQGEDPAAATEIDPALARAHPALQQLGAKLRGRVLPRAEGPAGNQSQGDSPLLAEDPAAGVDHEAISEGKRPETGLVAFQPALVAYGFDAQSGW